MDLPPRTSDENDDSGGRPARSLGGSRGSQRQALAGAGEQAIASWLGDAETDAADHAAIEQARAEAAKQGGIEFETFFDDVLEWSER